MSAGPAHHFEKRFSSFRAKMMRDQNSYQDCVGLPARSCFGSKSHAHAEDPRMIIHRGQRIQYVVIGYDRDLIGDAEVKLHTVVDLEAAKHNARAHKELVSVGAHAARPLRVVKSEFRPEIIQEVVLHGQAAEKRRADVVLLVSRERIANRSLDIKITPADATRDGGGDNPSRPVGKGGNAGWRLKSHKSS